MINNNPVTDCKQIANSFNKFYVNIGSTLAKNIPVVNKDPTSFITENAYSMFATPVLSDEVKTIIMSINNSSPGWDGINVKIVKQTCDLFLDALTHILNLSLVQGVFPNELKIAQVIPLYKGDNNMYINNYRPISILPVFSKVFEKVMYNRLFDFVNKYHLLYKYQFGFRPKHSTNIALITLIDKIMNSIDNGDIVIGIFLDFSKAFDTLNHTVLIQKMYKYGIRGVCLKWFENYLSNRKQYTIFNNVVSDESSINCGVPQGSVLGPLLFLLYINDIANVSNLFFTILFADDTNLFINGKNVHNLIESINQNLKKLVEWLKLNRLSLNVSKTNYMVFSLKKSVTFTSEIYINQDALKRVYSKKFLGIIIDSKLTWKEHVNHIRNKISKALGILYKSRKIFKVSTLLTIYYSFVYPYLIYCIEIWGSANDNVIYPLLKLQKRVVRTIVNAKFRAHTQPIFIKLNILNVSKLYEHFIILFMYKFNKGMLPSFVKDMFTVTTGLHSYETRQAASYKLYVPKGKTNAIYKTIRFKGIQFWNLILNKIDTNCGLATYKKKLKYYLLHNNLTE